MPGRINQSDRSPFAAGGVPVTLTDAPEDWCSLVEQIVELEEILAECRTSGDRDALLGLDQLRALLRAKRRRLRRIGVGGGVDPPLTR